MKKLNTVSIAAIASSLIAGTQIAAANTVALQNPSATFSQAGGFTVGKAIDGVLDGTGWAIFPSIASQAAVFETSTDIGYSGGSTLTFTISHLLGNFHNVGRFKISITTDDRSMFADGLATGGDVTANWTALTPLVLSATSGATFATQQDGSTLVSGANAAKDTYTLTTHTMLSAITGIRFDVMSHASLPAGGPGRANNGNFVLSEFQVSISPVPEPSQTALLTLGAISLLSWTKYRQRQRSKNL